jgi:hypothetical protein
LPNNWSKITIIPERIFKHIHSLGLRRIHLTQKRHPVDVAVFSSSKKDEDDIYIIVECKKNRKDGKTRLHDYLRFSKALLGVWFNGEGRLFLRKIEKGGEIEFEEIPNIPQYRQRIEDIGQIKRKDLKSTHNLKSTFKSTIADGASIRFWSGICPLLSFTSPWASGRDADTENAPSIPVLPSVPPVQTPVNRPGGQRILRVRRISACCGYSTLNRPAIWSGEQSFLKEPLTARCPFWGGPWIPAAAVPLTGGPPLMS